MSSTLIARPYAQAIFELARQQDAVSQWQNLLDNMVFAVDELLRYSNQKIEERRLVEIVVDLFSSDSQDNQSQQPQRLLALLAQNGRIKVLPAICDYFRQLAQAQAGIVSVDVELAKLLTDADTADFDQALSRWLNAKVDTAYRENSDLIGGVRIRIKDDVLDASILGRINRLAHTFL